MILSIVDRLDSVRKKEGLNKSQFEKKLSKSTGYLNMLVKRGSNPGSDVLAIFSKSFPNYCLEWLITGEGEMLKSLRTQSNIADPAADYKLNEVQAMHQDIKKDLNSLAGGMIKNFEVISTGVMQGLMDQRKLLDWTEKIDPDKINKSSEKLDEFLKQNQ